MKGTSRGLMIYVKSIIGQIAPDFVLQFDDGSMFDSSVHGRVESSCSFILEIILLLVREVALTFKEQYDLFKSSGCSIVGIGPGSYEKLKDFESTIGDLPFPLLRWIELQVGHTISRCTWDIPLNLRLLLDLIIRSSMSMIGCLGLAGMLLRFLEIFPRFLVIIDVGRTAY